MDEILDYFRSKKDKSIHVLYVYIYICVYLYEKHIRTEQTNFINTIYANNNTFIIINN